MDQGIPPSILIVKTSSIGDVIQTFPVLEYLRVKFPEAKIDWVVEEGIAPLVRSHPLIDQVIELRTKAWRKTPFRRATRTEFCGFMDRLRLTSYDLLFDLQGNIKSAFVTASAKAGCKVGFGWKSLREKGNFFATNRHFNPPAGINIRLKYLGLVQSYFGDLDNFSAQGVKLNISEEERERLQTIYSKTLCRKGPRFMVCFGSRWPNKRLAEETLASLLWKIAEDCDPSYLFIFGSEEEKQLADRLSSCFEGRSFSVGQLSLPLWQALMWEMDGVLAVDSAALHLCGTTQTPSFSVFGPSSALIYKPLEERHAVVQGSCPYGESFPMHCSKLRTCPTGACIRYLQADPLFEAYQLWFNKWCLPKFFKKGRSIT